MVFKCFEMPQHCTTPLIWLFNARHFTRCFGKKLSLVVTVVAVDSQKVWGIVVLVVFFYKIVHLTLQRWQSQAIGPVYTFHSVNFLSTHFYIVNDKIWFQSVGQLTDSKHQFGSLGLDYFWHEHAGVPSPWFSKCLRK